MDKYWAASNLYAVMDSMTTVTRRLVGAAGYVDVEKEELRGWLAGCENHLRELREKLND